MQRYIRIVRHLCSHYHSREFEWDNTKQRKLGDISLYIHGRFFQMANNICEPPSPFAQRDAEIELQAYEKEMSVKDCGARMHQDAFGLQDTAVDSTLCYKDVHNTCDEKSTLDWRTGPQAPKTQSMQSQDDLG